VTRLDRRIAIWMVSSMIRYELWHCCWGDENGLWWSVDEIGGIVYTHCLSAGGPDAPQGLNTSRPPFDFTGVCDVCGELVAGEGARHKECDTGQEGGRRG
jgi:hypothetical protein